MADEIKEVKKAGGKGNRAASVQKRKDYGIKMAAKRTAKKAAKPKNAGVLVKGKHGGRGKLITTAEIKNKAGKVVAIKSRSV